MSRDEALKRLRELGSPFYVDEANYPGDTPEAAWRRAREDAPSDTTATHMEADEILLGLIDDPEVREAFLRVHRWYS